MRYPRSFAAPLYDMLPDEVKAYMQKFTEILKRHHSDLYDDINPKSTTFADGDLTPSVRNGHLKIFKTANTAPTAITDFDDAQEGQIITVIIGDGNTTIADAGNFKLSAAFAPNADDVIQLVHCGNNWYEVSRASN